MLFPLGTGTSFWTTNTAVSDSITVNKAFVPLLAGKLPAAGTAPDGSDAMVASFPEGTVDLPSGQGFSFYSQAGGDGVAVTGAKEVMFSYSAFFQEGFQFNKGGKMPGMFGGTNFTVAKTCSGGRQDARHVCFSARLMWRTDGMGEIYNYLPLDATQPSGYCSTPPLTVCDPSFGDSIGRGAYNWVAGEWTTVAQRILLNDVGQANGEQELFVNGKSVINLSGLEISVDENTVILGVMAQTFFGGDDPTWASPQDQDIWFKDWSLAILQ